MATKPIPLEAKDCSKIELPPKKGKNKAEEFLGKISAGQIEKSIFSISKSPRDFDDDSPIVTYDHSINRWMAGRYIGEIESEECTLSITPRFGDETLLNMLGEIFNLKIVNGSANDSTKSNSIYIRLLITQIWLSKLTLAVRYGLPRRKVSRQSTDYTLRGKLMVKESIMPYATSKKVVSRYYETSYDEAIIAILYQAYTILKRSYFLDNVSIPFALKEQLKQIDNVGHAINRFVAEKDYQTLAYHPIYAIYKDVVDFSWQIIHSNVGLNNSNKNSSDTFGILIDMAEVWECYVRALLSKNLVGWSLVDNQFTLYPDMFYRRKIIPDIVLNRGSDYIVLDAKYKRMTFKQQDVDRSDFFQIHTYASFMKTKGNVVLSGLVYPTEDDNDSIVTKLFDNDDVNFFAGGIKIPNEEKGIPNEEKGKNYEPFLNMIGKYL